MVMFCLKKDAELFMVAEVCSVDVENKSLCVNWWTPTYLSRQKQQLFPNMTFAPEMDKVHIKNRIRGAPMWRLSAKIQTIQFNMVTFDSISSPMTKDCRQKFCESSMILG